MVSPLNPESAFPPISVGTVPAANKRTESKMKITISLIVTSSSSHNQENPNSQELIYPFEALDICFIHL